MKSLHELNWKVLGAASAALLAVACARQDPSTEPQPPEDPAVTEPVPVDPVPGDPSDGNEPPSEDPVELPVPPTDPPPTDPPTDPGEPTDPVEPVDPVEPPPTDPPPTPTQPGWRVMWKEDFSSPLPQGAWQPDPVPDDGPFSDAGLYFTQRGITPPGAFRSTVPFGASNWLTLESYSRTQNKPLTQHAAVVNDPADPSGTNKVLRLASPAHTDATVVRPTSALPENYRVSVRVGFAQFGDGKPGLNGYDAGNERAEPWLPNDSAVSQNGFYWLAILDAPPRPHNNVWIHHQRKVVIDSDNHSPPWMEIWDGQRFVSSGERPVMMFAVDGRGNGWETSGKPFISWSANAWQPSGTIRAVDRYLPGEWYTATIERKHGQFTLEVSGRFQHGGQRTYRGTIDAAARCVFHYNRPGEAAPSACIDTRYWPSLTAAFPHWPAQKGWDDWFMFGDPHSNFYEGQVLYDDVTLEVWDDGTAQSP